MEIVLDDDGEIVLVEVRRADLAADVYGVNAAAVGGIVEIIPAVIVSVDVVLGSGAFRPLQGPPNATLKRPERML